jgi:transaldolase
MIAPTRSGAPRSVSQLKVKLFADGADKSAILELYRNPAIAGFTTNPTLMRKAGISDFEAFARDLLETVHDRPISFEVFADEIDEMERQARKIATWGENVYVKIPITNTRRVSTATLVSRLTADGIKVNITALLTLAQVEVACSALRSDTASYVSVFAGRIADTGCDPVPIMREATAMIGEHRGAELIWASPRELLNVFQADDIGCHIITATSDVLAKLQLVGKDLNDYSLETVKMFYNDARNAGFTL